MGIARDHVILLLPSASVALRASIVLAVCFGALGMPALMVRMAKPNDDDSAIYAEHLAEFFVGSTYSLGMVLSGLTLPARVIAFLSPFKRCFNPTMLFTIMTAPLSALLAFSAVQRRNGPVCRPSFSDPIAEDIGVKLVLGAVLFGLGWGLSGMSPGQMLVNLMFPDEQLLVVAAGMLLGFLLDCRIVTPAMWKPGTENRT